MLVEVFALDIWAGLLHEGTLAVKRKGGAARAVTGFPGGVTVEFASFHQKFVAIDDREAFLGGMNVKDTDWDSSAHLVFDHRRMKFDADAAARQKVIDKEAEPDLGPRKDYMLLQLRAFDTVVTWGVDETESRFADMDVHSKMLIVDDVYMSVGSCNKNNRGLLYEGEANISVVDEAFVTAARRRIFSNLVDQSVASDDPAALWAILRGAADHNDDAWRAWEAEGGTSTSATAPTRSPPRTPPRASCTPWTTPTSPT